MRGDGAAGCASGGCAGLSLLGLLVGVGLTVWLASMALPGPSAKEREPRTTTTAASSERPAIAEVVLDPAGPIEEGATIRASAEGFDAGTTVWVTTCVHGGSPVAVPSPCDQASVQRAVADAEGVVVVDYRPHRVVDAGPLPVDCASAADTCEVRLASSSGRAVVGTAPFSFVAGLPAPEITLPG